VRLAAWLLIGLVCATVWYLVVVGAVTVAGRWGG
jgi:hypothetical protein